MIKILKEKLVTYYWFRSKIITSVKSSTQSFFWRSKCLYFCRRFDWRLKTISCRYCVIRPIEHCNKICCPIGCLFKFYSAFYLIQLLEPGLKHWFCFCMNDEKWRGVTLKSFRKYCSNCDFKGWIFRWCSIIYSVQPLILVPILIVIHVVTHVVSNVVTHVARLNVKVTDT